MRTILKVFAALLGVALIAVLGVWLWLRGPDIPYATLEAKYANADSHFADLPGGIYLHYRDEGNKQGPLLLLIHGFGDNLWSWDGWVKRLGDRYHIIRVDLPGHGLTRAPEIYTLKMDELADAIDALAASLSLPKFVVAGNSLGGAVAWQMAVRYPDRLNGLILVDAAGWPSETLKDPPLAFKLLQYPIGRAFLASIDNKPLIRDSLLGEVGNKTVITDEIIDRWAELQRAPGHRGILMSIQPGTRSRATAEVLGAIRVPTLVLWGELDPFIEVKSAHKFADAIPGSELTVYPGVGHLPQIEIPERSGDDVAAFVQSHVTQ